MNLKPKSVFPSTNDNFFLFQRKTSHFIIFSNTFFPRFIDTNSNFKYLSFHYDFFTRLQDDEKARFGFKGKGISWEHFFFIQSALSV